MATRPKFSRIQASSHVTGLTLAALVVLAVHVVGTVGYKLIGGPQASWFDSFYMTFITVATIGYTEVIDLTGHPGGRIFTVVIAFIGIGAMTYVFSTVTANTPAARSMPAAISMSSSAPSPCTNSASGWLST